jgi:hypothetical protein
MRKHSLTRLASLLPLLAATIARADFYPIPLTPGSFNYDVVVERTASAPLQTLVTANFDAGTNLAGISAGGGNGGNQGSLVELGATSSGTGGIGVPFHGATFTAISNAPGTTSHQFQMAPDYTANNAIFIGGSGTVVTQIVSGTFNLTTPASYDHLSVLATAGNGPTRVVYYVTYGDGSQDANFFDVMDWFSQNNAVITNTAWICNGDFRGSDGTYQQVAQSPQQIRLYYSDIPVNSSLQVSNIQFVYYNGGRAGIFGLSGSIDSGANYTPITVTGYNADMIIENPLAKAITVTMDNGPLLVSNPNRGDNNTWYEVGYNLIQAANTWTGIPLHGSSFAAWSNATHVFTMPASYVGNNVCFIGNYSGFMSGTMTLSSPGTYTNLSILNACGNGPTVINYTIHHADTTTETGTYNSQDWFSSSFFPTNGIAYIAAGRVPMGRAFNVINNGGSLTSVKLWFTDIPVGNTGSAVTSIDYSYVSGGRSCMFALSGCDGTTASNLPIALNASSYNADAVVEASAITNVDARVFTTATMDGGTNNNANTWYEKGWDPFNPNSGLPQAGTVITSTNLPDHHYVMPASYTGPNAAYCDSNQPTTTITFANPTNVFAVSFLSANANGGIQIQVVLNHQSAAPETNFFSSLDWFNGISPAFTAAGRLNSDNRSMNNFIPASTNPRFYEAQFAVVNTNDPIVSATLRWTTNNGTGGTSSTSSRFVVMAVSGTTNLVAPILSINPVGTNVYEGSNIVLSAGIAGGTPPITFEWRKGTNGVYGPAIANGGVYSGATTTNLTITGIGWSNSADYVFIAKGTGGNSTSVVATVNAYSTLPRVTIPSDPITEYQPNGGSSPPAQTVPHAIDTVANAAYVNYGQNAGGSPFVGPVGFVVSPRLGKTLVTAVRLYTADANQPNDPANWTLEGSNDGGSTWATIHSVNFASVGLSLPVARNTTGALNPLTQVVREIHFANANGYTSYRVSFGNTTNDAVATAIGIGDVELLGVQAPSPPLIVQQPRSVTVWAGANPEFYVLATGFPTNLAYQWFRGGLPIGGATSSSYTLINAQPGDNGAQFSCQVTNSQGPSNSLPATLTVSGSIPAQAYPQAVTTDHPVGYWRLGDTDTGYPNNGVIAHDYWGGLDGSYSNTVLGSSGYNPSLDPNTAATFGTLVSPVHNSFVDAIGGIDFSAPSNTSRGFSIEAWVLNGLTGGQLNGAGIVTKGYGGGGEQFLLDTGAGNSAFRFVVRNAAGAILGGNANATIGPTNEVGPFDISNPAGGNWHHVVGVVDEANSNIVIYVDGIANAAGAVFNSGLGILYSPLPVTIGSRTPNLNQDFTNNFVGTIDDVAIYNYALSPARVLAHYYAAGPLPIFTLQPTNADYSDGGPLAFYANSYGPSVTYQWYSSPDQNTWTAVGGQTSPTFNSPNTSASFGPYAELVATDSFGSRTSVVVTATVHSGAPVIITDLPPTNVVYASGSISLAIAAYGTAPLSYLWYKSADDVTYTPMSNGGRISGATSNVLTIASALSSDTAFYKVNVSNGNGNLDSTHEYLLVQSQGLFNGNGLGWRLNGENPPVNGGAATSISNNVFTPTDGTGGENRSAWYSSRLYCGAFQASFTYQDVGGAGADGVAFVIQNQGFTALGGGGGGLAYSGITPSVALMIDIYNAAAGGTYNNGGVLLNMNGTAVGTANPYYQPAPLNIRAGNPITVNVRYFGGVLSATLFDTVALNSFSTNVLIDIPTIVGTNAAIVGLTGSEGGVLSHQTISNFVYTPLATLKATASGNNIVLTWPAAIGGYVLQSTISLAPQNWQPVNNAVTQVNGNNQVTVPQSSGSVLFRLSLQ